MQLLANSVVYDGVAVDVVARRSRTHPYAPTALHGPVYPVQVLPVDVSNVQSERLPEK